MYVLKVSADAFYVMNDHLLFSFLSRQMNHASPPTPQDKARVSASQHTSLHIYVLISYYAPEAGVLVRKFGQLTPLS
jgi:hypothetical protein